MTEPCSVCLSPLHVRYGAETIAAPFQCAHQFHKSCAERWIEKSATCPECRAPAPVSLSLPGPAISLRDLAERHRDPAFYIPPSRYFYHTRWAQRLGRPQLEYCFFCYFDAHDVIQRFVPLTVDILIRNGHPEDMLELYARYIRPLRPDIFHDWTMESIRNHMSGAHRGLA